MAIPFPCKQCGKCCRMLAREGYIGISLFPWEKHLFPEEDVRPSLGLGENPDQSKFKIILYTYDAPGCIHLDGNLCVIHDQRPLVCRSYPFRISGEGKNKIYIVAPECNVIQSWPKKKTIEIRYQEMDAADLIGDHLSRFYKATETKWRFYKNKGWSRIGTNKISG